MRPASSRRAGLASLFLTVVLLATACSTGGAQSDRSATSSSSSSTAVLAVVGKEFSFTPAALTAVAGETTIRFTNKGTTGHDLLIDELHVHLMADAGETVEADVTLAPGTYAVYCSIPGHRSGGMEGTLTVS
ncbi:hypothetical protein E3T25_07285 [Cryobacterium sandaracinum]|uniref:EfeO-type cupredoxin-like domain-containing protein n=1 Tax=Cryobacterium sandaracinum TaxID=1259247 RepID=A0ABY2JDA3_9MICO|nr:hypothetical protein E3T25_07285 [Cryobacterium sandaracinum]